jgi:hypothetical protein
MFGEITRDSLRIANNRTRNETLLLRVQARTVPKAAGKHDNNDSPHLQDSEEIHQIVFVGVAQLNVEASIIKIDHFAQRPGRTVREVRRTRR